MRIGLIAKALGAQLFILLCASEGIAAPCVAPPVSPQAIAQFKSNPQAIVAPNSDTRTIEAFVRDLVGTDATLAVDFVQLAKGTTPRFQTAIAAGLAQAAIACTNIDQQAALLIQQAVASFQDGEFQSAFAAVAGDLSTAATAAATSSANSSVGSVVITNPNGGGASSTNPGGGGSSSFFQINSSGVATTGTSFTTNLLTRQTTTAANPVSPTR
jgi:hypothetical protein